MKRAITSPFPKMNFLGKVIVKKIPKTYKSIFAIDVVYVVRLANRY